MHLPKSHVQTPGDFCITTDAATHARIVHYKEVSHAPKLPQPLHPYLVKIETPTGKSTTLPVTLLTPKQAEQVQVEFKRLAHEAGIKGARINVQRVVADDYEKVISEAKACLRTAMPKAA
jgi:hypothetical protein